MTNHWNHQLRVLLWDILRNTSRTFYLSIRQLPGEVGDSLCLAYLMLRVSDYLEDNELMSAEEKVKALKCWNDILVCSRPAEDLYSKLPESDTALNPDLFAAQNAGMILQALSTLPEALQATIISHVSNSTLGMARWVEKGPVFINEADLDDYMHEVAGRVGYLSTEVFAWHYPVLRSRLKQLMPMARETGLALQTVNIIRGLRKDYERGWIFVPETYCAPFNLKPGEIFNPEYEDKALQIVDLLVLKAQRHLANAVDYILCLPPWLHRLRLACIWPMLFAARTLAISRKNLKVLIGEVKITRKEVKHIIFDSSLMGWSNRWIVNYYQKLQKIPET